MDVGFVGLGAMGRPMAANLAAAGHRVVAWNRSPVEPPEGVTLAKSLRDLAQEAPVVFTMLTDGPAVEAVLFGEDGWVSGAAPGGVVIQSSTIGPTAVVPIAERLESAGLHLLDAPVSGSVKPAINRELVILGGGDPELFERFRPLFEAISARTVQFGPVGAGSSAKLAVNGLLVAVIAAAAESISWLTAREPGIDIKAFASAIDRISPLAVARAEALAGSAPKGGFSLRQAGKDMELVVGEFGRAEVMTAVRELTRAGLSMGMAELDMACLGATVRGRKSE
jgi:3-hydroxyisobutyrate dehydrogenase-like beta-hydroxyacid dehydrogenase